MAAIPVAALELGDLGLPSYNTVTVRGDDQPQPLSSAIAAFDRADIVTVIPPDTIRAIDEARLVPAAEADDIDEDDFVIGVEVAGEARAYPVKVLSAHEIVNDAVRGRPFAVTW